MTNKNRPSNRNVILFVSIALVIFMLGYFTRSALGSTKTAIRADMSLFWKVWDVLEQKYPFEQPSNEDKIYAAISGLVDAYGDDYSSFLEPAKNKFFEGTISGEFAGAGLEIGIRNGLLTIISPLKNSPAEKAGFMAGDIITHVDGVDVMVKTFNEVMELIRGDVDTQCTITIIRPSTDLSTKVQDITFTRDIVQIPILDTHIEGDTFIISLYNFNNLSEAKFKDALIAFKNSGKHQLLLDLRNNPGGYLTSSIDIASYFLPQGKVIVQESFGLKEKDIQVYRSLGYNLLDDYKYSMIILINEGSASAAEIVAAALGEQGAAKVVGETSFGKGSVQEVVELDSGTSLKITIAKWLTPNGNQISDIGISPEITIYPDSNDTYTMDTQLKKAIRLFNTTNKQ